MAGIMAANVKVSQLIPHPDNPRKDVGDVSELAKSIKENGIMQNLTVFPVDESFTTFMVLIGHRRLAAAKMAGLTEVPCKIIHSDIPSRAKQIEIMLEENMQRHDLTPVEEAESFQLCLDLGETVEDLKKKTGFSESTIRHRLNIAKLDKNAVQKKLDSSFQLTLTDLYALEKLDSVEERNRILDSARDRSDFNYQLNSAVRKQERDKILVKWIKAFNDAGVKEAPKNIHYYSGGWEEIESFNPVHNSDKGIKPDFSEYSGKGYFWKDEGTNIYILKKEDKKEQLEADKEKKRKQLEDSERKNKFNAEWNELKDRMFQCIQMILDGSIKYDTNKVSFPDLMSITWDALLGDEWRTFEVSSCLFTLAGGKVKTYNMKKEDKEKYMGLYSTLPIEMKMLCCIGYHLAEYTPPPLTYDFHYDKPKAMHCTRIINLLQLAGFDINDNDIKMIAGTHEIYVKEDK